MADPYIDNVKALLHFDTEVGSTTLTDEFKNATFTLSGGTSAISANGRFNNGLTLTGNGFWTTPVAPWMQFEQGDFTIEFFVRTGGLPVNNRAILTRTVSQTGGHSWGCILRAGKPDFYWTTNGSTALRITSSIDLTLNTWVHYAVSRNGSTIRLFLDGVQVATGTIGLLYDSPNRPMGIGGDDGSAVGTYGFQGQIDELRITKGAGRYTANFTPPQAPFDGPTPTFQDSDFTVESIEKDSSFVKRGDVREYAAASQVLIVQNPTVSEFQAEAIVKDDSFIPRGDIRGSAAATTVMFAPNPVDSDFAVEAIMDAGMAKPADVRARSAVQQVVMAQRNVPVSDVTVEAITEAGVTKQVSNVFVEAILGLPYSVKNKNYTVEVLAASTIMPPQPQQVEYWIMCSN